MSVSASLQFILVIIGALVLVALLFDVVRKRYQQKRAFTLEDLGLPDPLAEDMPTAEMQAEPTGILQMDTMDGTALTFDASESNSHEPAETAMTKGREIVEQATQKKVLALYVIAESGRPYVGYELLQAILSSGLRYGNMRIFHYHVNRNSKAPVLFSLASAVEPGIFEIQQMGAVSTPGLCLFMQLSAGKDNHQALELMRQTAQILVNDLGGSIRDESQALLTDTNWAAMQRAAANVISNRVEERIV